MRKAIDPAHVAGSAFAHLSNEGEGTSLCGHRCTPWPMHRRNRKPPCSACLIKMFDQLYEQQQATGA